MSPATAEWVAKADEDYQSMSWEMLRKPTPNYGDACFHAQQCIEKLLKAVLTEHGIPFTRTHDLFDLSNRVAQTAPTWSFSPADLSALMPGAVLYRYPGVDATAIDSQRAIAACNRLQPTLLALL